MKILSFIFCSTLLLYQIFQFKELLHEVNCQRREQNKITNIFFHMLYKQNINKKAINKKLSSTQLNIYSINKCKRKIDISQVNKVITLIDGKKSFRYEIRKIN
jgi:hypothetical protein